MALQVRIASPCTEQWESGSWFDLTVGARLIDAREALRDTRTLGPLIDELYPQVRTFRGEMALPPTSPAP